MQPRIPRTEAECAALPDPTVELGCLISYTPADAAALATYIENLQLYASEAYACSAHAAP